MKRKIPLHVKIFIGLFAGLAAGLFCNIVFGRNENIEWVVNNIAFPAGQVFLRLIFMIVIPLIFTAIVLGVADFRDINKIERVGLKTLMFTVVITSISVITGIFMVNLVRPGNGISKEYRTDLLATLTNNQSVSGIIGNAEKSKSFVQTALDLIPRNPFADIAGAFDPAYQGGGLLALMFFSLMFGIALAVTSPERTSGLTGFLQGLYDVIMKLIDFAMKLAPYGVAGLVFSTASQMGLKIISILFLYVLVVLSALAIHLFLTYGVILKFAVKKIPFSFLKT
jgi:Na+/H+-dicarboxylate symporters